MNRLSRDHKIYGSGIRPQKTRSRAEIDTIDSGEAGYTLVALLAVMTVMALFALAVVPDLRLQAMREQEKEAIFRGEQIADAIRTYYLYRRATGPVGDQALPTSIDQLLEGVPIPGGTKNRQILRANAARDPLSKDGEWGLIQPRTQRLIDFQRSVLLYTGGLIPPPRSPQMVELQRLMAPQLVNVLPGGASDSSSSNDAGTVSSGPFIGVHSRSQRSSVLHYYGIEQHNEWIFTPLFR